MAGVDHVREVHDLHIWGVTSGFPALSAHVLVGPGEDCHGTRRQLELLLHPPWEAEGRRYPTAFCFAACRNHSALRLGVRSSRLEVDVSQPRTGRRSRSPIRSCPANTNGGSSHQGALRCGALRTLLTRLVEHHRQAACAARLTVRRYSASGRPTQLKTERSNTISSAMAPSAIRRTSSANGRARSSPGRLT
jgi:hypothetical protein